MRNLTLAAIFATAAFVGLMPPAHAGPVGFSYSTYNVPGSTDSWLSGVNDLGQFVGGSNPSGNFYTTPSGARVTIPGAGLHAFGINNSSTVVGYRDAGFTQEGFVYSGGSLQALNVPGASGTRAYGINDVGVIVGDYNDATGFHGFTYNAGTFSTFNVPTATVTTGYGINNVGQITGLYQRGSGDTFRSFLYNGLSFVDVVVPGSGFNWARGINDAGEISGVYAAAIDSTQHNFVFTGSDYLTFDLSGALFSSVWGINNDGLLVGSFLDANVRGDGFYGRITDAGGGSSGVPEPANITLLVLGLGFLTVCVRKRALT